MTKLRGDEKDFMFVMCGTVALVASAVAVFHACSGDFRALPISVAIAGFFLATLFED